MRLSHQRRIAIRVVGLAAVAAMALGVQGTVAGETIVTRGEFAAFATSSDPAFTGHATMVRTADGKTIVTVNVRGLAPSTTYGSHVHARACGDTFAGGHYKDDLAGPASPPNEIWPAFVDERGRRRKRQRDRALGRLAPRRRPSSSTRRAAPRSPARTWTESRDLDRGLAVSVLRDPDRRAASHGSRLLSGRGLVPPPHGPRHERGQRAAAGVRTDLALIRDA